MMTQSEYEQERSARAYYVAKRTKELVEDEELDYFEARRKAEQEWDDNNV